jgi:hypothetical protein
MGGKKRHKQHPQGATTTVDYDDGSGRNACSSGMGCIVTAVHREAPRGGLPKPRVPHQAQAQGVRHDEFHDLRGPSPKA